MNEVKKGLNPIAYLKEAREELAKVSWPTKKEAVRYSAIVVAVTVGLAVFFTIIDLALTFGLDRLVKITS